MNQPPSAHLDVDAFTRQDRTILDVRTPAEFEQGHIPGALNLPLFSNSERAEVGTLYAERGQRQAILLGLELIGPRMRELLERVVKLVGQPEETTTLHLHCWRGGMRSQSVAWLLELYGYSCVTLEGGYKSFRRATLDRLERFGSSTPPLAIVGGSTGSGKTLLIERLKARGEQVIDLEALALHRGSSFGAVGLKSEQPSTERFENELAEALRHSDPNRLLWLEDESRMIGHVPLPKPFFEALRRAPVYVVDVPRARRLDLLTAIYGEAPKRELVDGFVRIRKRLGGAALSSALEALDRQDLRAAASLALDYYDKTYAHSLTQRDEALIVRLERLSEDRFDLDALTEQLIQAASAPPTTL